MKLGPILTRLGRLDRRWLFLLLAVSIVVPLLVPLNLSMKPSRDVRATQLCDRQSCTMEGIWRKRLGPHGQRRTR